MCRTAAASRAHAIQNPAFPEPRVAAAAAHAIPDPTASTSGVELPPFDAAEAWTPGEVYDVQAPSEFKAFALQLSHERPVMLMCKAKACRPCKVFARTYARYAAANPEIVFLAVVGDASNELRRMMVLLKVASTPAFMTYRSEEKIHSHAGRSEEKMEAALDVCYRTLDAAQEPAERKAARAAGVQVVDSEDA